MKITLTILSLIICSAVYAHKDKTYQCYWHDDTTDVFKLPGNDFKYSEEDRVYYHISNDSNNIYIDLKIFDDEIKQQVLRSGMAVWIDPEGKKEKRIGVIYPVRHPGQNSGEMPASENSHNTYEHHAGTGSEETPDLYSNALMLIGFSESGPEMITDFEKDNFRGSITIRKELNMMYYEVVMPISKLSGVINAGKGRKTKSTLMMGFSYESAPGGLGSPNGHREGRQSGWNGHGMSGEGGRMHGGGGMHGGGMHGGGMYGGGMHGGGRTYEGGGRGNSSDSESLKIFWLKDINLAGSESSGRTGHM